MLTDASSNEGIPSRIGVLPSKRSRRSEAIFGGVNADARITAAHGQNKINMFQGLRHNLVN
jgi:hypothetical protein